MRLLLGEGFQFTRPRGARHRGEVARVLGGGFQFTRPRGARPRRTPTLPAIPWFQFTRPRGARHLKTVKRLLTRSFQFTRPRGARQDRFNDYEGFVEFQFTRPRGARQNLWYNVRRQPRFNSRAREGRDVLYKAIREQPANVSIHAPARGATLQAPLRESSPSCFNSRAREGRDVTAYCITLFHRSAIAYFREHP